MPRGPDRLNDSRNHTAPLLDAFPDDADLGFTYLVLPLLQRYYRPEFSFVDEVVDFIRQLSQVCHFSDPLFMSLTFFRAFVICMKSESRIGERLG